MSFPARLENLVSFVAVPLLLVGAAMAQNPSATPIAPLAPVGTGTPLPEPLTWTLVGMATVGVGFATRRGKRGRESDSAQS